MKKILLLILTFILIPLNINAAEITNTEISGTTEKNIGEEFILDFKVNLSELTPGIDKTLGIWLAGFELVFDENVLIASEISSNGFESYIYKEDNKYYVISETIENSGSQNLCANNLLYCGNYEVSIKFYIKDTELNETIVKMKEIEIGLLDIIDQNKTYTLDDLIELTKQEETIHTIKINKTTEEIKDIPTSITTNNNPINESSKEPPKQEIKEETKSSNAFIKNIFIDNYDIDFEKNKTNYNLKLNKDINELDINVVLEDQKATYKIIGADDIKNNNNEIAIIVTAEDNNILTYTINIKYLNETEEITPVKEKINIKKLITKYLTKDNLTYIGITIGIIIIIILLIILKNKRENKKINKLLGEL